MVLWQTSYNLVANNLIKLLRSDGEVAVFPTEKGSDAFPVYIGRGLDLHIVRNVST